MASVFSPGIFILYVGDIPALDWPTIWNTTEIMKHFWDKIIYIHDIHLSGIISAAVIHSVQAWMSECLTWCSSLILSLTKPLSNQQMSALEQKVFEDILKM